MESRTKGCGAIYSKGRLLLALRLMLTSEREPARRILCSLPFLTSLRAMRLDRQLDTLRICASSLRIE